jgi:hypothetical protein
VCEAIRHTSINYLEPSCDSFYDELQNLNLSRISSPRYHRVSYATLAKDTHYNECVSLAKFFLILDTGCVLFEVEAGLLVIIHINVILTG